jgi:hypothetical protein
MLPILMKNSTLGLLFVALLLGSHVPSVMAADHTGQPKVAGPQVGDEPTDNPTESAKPSTKKVYEWTDTQWHLTWGIVGFSTLLFAGQFFIMCRSKIYWSDRQFKAFTLTLILTVGLIVIIAGFAEAQIAPMMGLIGTIAGYILGSDRTTPTTSPEKHREPPPT